MTSWFKSVWGRRRGKSMHGYFWRISCKCLLYSLTGIETRKWPLTSMSRKGEEERRLSSDHTPAPKKEVPLPLMALWDLKAVSFVDHQRAFVMTAFVMLVEWQNCVLHFVKTLRHLILSGLHSSHCFPSYLTRITPVSTFHHYSDEKCKSQTISEFSIQQCQWSLSLQNVTFVALVETVPRVAITACWLWDQGVTERHSMCLCWK